jgi:hypothetical protein
MIDFGTGPKLADANPWLRSKVERISRILDVTERNCAIEGLPRLSNEVRERLRGELMAADELVPAHRE